MRMDLLEYKTNIKDLIERTTKKNGDQIIENTIKVDRADLKMSETLNLVNIIKENFESFNR